MCGRQSLSQLNLDLILALPRGAQEATFLSSGIFIVKQGLRLQGGNKTSGSLPGTCCPFPSLPRR